MSFDYKRLVKVEHNVSQKEAKIRMGAGAAALLVSLFPGSVPLLLIGLVLTGTGYSGWCPAYSAMNKDTLEVSTSEEASTES